MKKKDNLMMCMSGAGGTFSRRLNTPLVGGTILLSFLVPLLLLALAHIPTGKCCLNLPLRASGARTPTDSPPQRHVASRAKPSGAIGAAARELG